MMYALGIARDLGANHAVGVAVVLRAAHPADPAIRQQFNIERTRRRAIVRAR
jgi:hypothetical protein